MFKREVVKNSISLPFSRRDSVYFIQHFISFFFNEPILVFNEPGSSCLDDSVLSGRVIQVLLGTTNSSSLEDTSKKPKIAKKKRPDANLLKQNLLNVYHKQ